MSAVESRIVSLTFDNTSFQTKVGDTLSMLDKLKNALNFSKTTQSMGELQGAASKFDMSTMGSAIEGISAKFAALATIGITALANLTNRAIDSGIKIAKSLSLDGIMDGFSEYETNMNSIQTILANTKSKGSTLEDVNKTLDELNVYSDKTIYNFAEMAKNIGTFTAAGVGLDTSAKSIKGIANLAAMSGSNSQQASTAMYQLSQAIAAGSVKLMDWNSVVNAGMGGEAFKTALFETGKAMGTLANVPIGQSFNEWEASGNNFRESLQEGWITADVLTTTLGGLSGDMDAAALSAKGFSDEQVKSLLDLAATATASATEVKTASQLFGTIKEAIGTGWATSFRTVVGDFGEAKSLFTGLNDFIGGFINKSADARNELLAGWKAFGGREVLMQGFVYSLSAVTNALKPIKDAFREVFPPKTAGDLISMTVHFRDLAKTLSEFLASKADTIKGIFAGIFSIFRIGIEIVKGLVSVLKTIGGVFFGLLDGVDAGAAGVGNFISKLREMLVEGGGIAAFFNVINKAIQKFGDILLTIKDKITGIFGGGEGIPGGEKTSGVIEAVTDKLKVLSTIGDKAGNALSSIGDAFKRAFDKIKEILSAVWGYISNFFSTLGDKIGSVFTADAFSPALKAVNTGLLAGIAATFVMFFKKGLKLDFGQFGFLESVSKIFDELGGTLKAFQTQLKADALMKIAAAIGVLTVSVVVLSMIDSKRLASSMTALGVGFGQLVASMALLSKIESSPAKLVGLAVSLIVLSGAALILTVAVKNLSKLSWGELVKGLVGVLGTLQLMSMAAAFFGSNSKSFIRSGISLIVLSTALWLFSKVITTFASIPIGDIAKGLAAIGASLAVFIVTMNLMNSGEITKLGLGFVLLAFGLRGIKTVVEAFASMDWGAMLKGFFGMTVALHIIISALRAIPKNSGAMAVGLIIASAAIYILSKAVASMGNIAFGDLLKGLLGMGAALLMLTIAVNAMQGAVAGAGAIVLISGAMWILANVLKTIGSLSIGQLLTGLIGMAAVLVILGAAALALVAFPPLIPALFLMGAALMVVGAGFALFGVGAALTAKALVELGSAGKKSIETLVQVLNTVIKAIPGFVQAFAEGIVKLVNVLLDAAPQFIDKFDLILTKILDLIIKIMPKIAEAFGALIDTAAKIIIEKSPTLITAGMTLLINFMTGIRNNIYQITQLAIEILTGFIQSLADNVGMLMAAASNLMVAFIQGLMAHALNMVQAGVDLLVQFLNGIAVNIGKVVQAATNIITTIITSIAGMANQILQAGLNILVSFISGITNNISRIVSTATTMVTKLITEIGANAGRVITAGVDVAIKFLDGLVDNSIKFVDKAGALILKLLEGWTAAVKKYSGQIRSAGLELAGAIIDGITGGLASKAGDLFGSVKDLAGGAIGAFKGMIKSNSPSKVFYAIGLDVVQGFVNAIRRDTSAANTTQRLARNATEAFNDAISNLGYGLSNIDEFNPRITPVLDLSKVVRDSKDLTSILGSGSISAGLSLSTAASISRAANASRTIQSDNSTAAGMTTVKFEQNNYSPRALTANDIYRNTRNQISLAKEELSIP